MDDGVVVGAALSVGLYLLATALAELCPPGAHPFRTQGCNPRCAFAPPGNAFATAVSAHIQAHQPPPPLDIRAGAPA